MKPKAATQSSLSINLSKSANHLQAPSRSQLSTNLLSNAPVTSQQASVPALGNEEQLSPLEFDADPLFAALSDLATTPDAAIQDEQDRLEQFVW